MTAAERLVVAANRRFYKTATAAFAAASALAFVGAPTETSTTRIGLYLSGSVMAGAFILGLLRLRMVKFPQLVADKDGFTVVTLFTRRTFPWTDLQEVEEAFYGGLVGRQQSKLRVFVVFGKPIRRQPKIFRFRARGRLYAVISPVSHESDDLDDIREQFVSMWHQHAPASPRGPCPDAPHA